MSTVLTTAATARKKQRTAGRWFYVIVALLVVLLNVVSFAPAMTDPSTRTVPLPLTSLDLAHGVVSTAWVLVFLAQTTLVAVGRPTLHRRLGVAGVLLSAAFVVVTWFVLVAGARRGFDLSGDLVPRGSSQEPGAFLAPANVLVVIGLLVGFAAWYHRRPAVHKRLMLLAFLVSTGAPIAHLVGHWPALRAYPVINPISGMLILMLFLIHDRWSSGRIHPAALWGAIGAWVWQIGFFLGIVSTDAWRAFAVWVVK